MAETEQKEQVTYTPEELEEINRIQDVAMHSSYARPLGTAPVEVETPSDLDQGSVDDISDLNIGEPDNLDLPMGDFDVVEEEEAVTPVEPLDEIAAAEDIPLDDLMGVAEEQEIESLDDTAISEIEGEDLAGISDTEIEDISDLIEEVDDVEDIAADDISFPDDTPGDIEPLEDLSTDLTEEPEDVSGDFEEFDFAGGDTEEITPVEETPAGDTSLSALDELDALTAEEPESLDDQELADNEFVGGDELSDLDEAPGEVGEIEDVEDTIPEIDLDDLSAPVETTEAPSDDGVALEQNIESEIPDLSDISFDEGEDIPEAAETDIPDIDFEDIGGEGTGEEPSMMDEIDDFEEPAAVEPADVPGLDEFSEEPAGVGGLDDLDDIDIEPIDDLAEPIPAEQEDLGDDLAIEPLDEDDSFGDVETPGGDEPGSLELSDRELRKLKKAIILLHPNLRTAIKDIIVNDRLETPDARRLVDLVMDSRPEQDIADYIEEKLGTVVDLSDEAASSGRRVLHARPEYTREGRDRQKRLLKVTRIFAIAAFAGLGITLLSYNFIYKPMMAKKKIHEGVELILKPGTYLEKPGHYVAAEALAVEVEKDFRPKYVYGYNAYGDAYFRQKEYNRSYKKYNNSYKLEPGNVKTLNALGKFYSKVPKAFYSSVRGEVSGLYFEKRPGKPVIDKQLDLAIEFFRRVLLKKPKDITAMVGIGNAYFYQGQFLKAKKYYTDILKIDHKSPVGWGGLLNLYIERDAYDLVATTHTEIRHRKLSAKLESPLLAKLANYYLTHRKSDRFNVRVDHGVMSPRLADMDDNTYPAVRSVLRALNERDPEYPPLFLMSAKLARTQNNYKVMKRHLDRALKAEPDYFGALHMMGAYYYDISQPSKAYGYLTKAVQAFGHPPEFTKSDFYKETEEIGETYTLMGNVFYYFFDRVKYRYGSLEDEAIDKNLEKLANFNIAREKYEKALEQKFKSPELHYNLGRIYYLNRLYRKSLDQWLNLYDDLVDRPELMFALGNAFYHLGNYEAAKGEYLKLINVSEFEAEQAGTVVRTSSKHIRLFHSLSSAYNNMGAVYQLQKDESRSSISYWKSIDYAKRLGYENEFARVNLARSLNRKKPPEPVLDENLPYSIQYYREDMRK